MKIIIDKAELRQALLCWEQQARDEAWPPRGDTPVEQAASENADHLWQLLTLQEPPL